MTTVKVHFGTDFVDQSSEPSTPRELLVELDRAAPATLASQLEGQLREAVRSGRLRAGGVLPSTRALAAQLGVSHGLVVGAYYGGVGTQGFCTYVKVPGEWTAAGARFGPGYRDDSRNGPAFPPDVPSSIGAFCVF